MSDIPAGHAVYLASTVTCAHCLHCGAVVRLDPDYHGWQHWCANCEHLTQPSEQAKATLQSAQDTGAIGIVSAIALPWPEVKALVDLHVTLPPKPIRPRPTPNVTFLTNL